MNKLPLARSTDIVVQKMGKEILIYDMKTHKAYNLNETSTVVYNACDGVTSFDKLKSEYQFTDDLIFLALNELKEENLIEEDKSFALYFAGMSRRDVIKKVGLGSMVALPLISSLVAPTAAHAQSGATCVTTGCTCFFGDIEDFAGVCDSEDCDQSGCTCLVPSTDSCTQVNGGLICYGACGAGVSPTR